MDQNHLTNCKIKHAISYQGSYTAAKYSTYTKPFKILIGGVKESHTREDLLQISARIMGWTKRSKIPALKSKNSGLSNGGVIFREREREWEEAHLVRPSIGQRRPLAAAWPSPAGGTHLCPWGVPQVSPNHFYGSFEKIKIVDFFWNFSKTFPEELKWD